MTDSKDRLARLSPDRRALVELLRGQATPGAPEPIAILGMGVRMPGAPDVPALWRLLCEGRSAISRVPPDRWDADAFHAADPAAPGKTTSRWGGFLEAVDRFDAGAFRISAHEAARMDPQQRLLLEVAWEALDDAGLVRESLAGSATGVFVGVMSNDYGARQWGDLRRIDEHAGTGNAASVAANRISYVFDLRGPSVALSTACSSSLVAVHQACASLWSGESELALAGGVNVILSPAGAISLTKSGVLSSEAICRPFDARASGLIRGEGAGIVVLKRLSRALADGDPIYALIRGAAVNQNGRGNGLSSPSQEAQEAVLRAAYRRAGVAPGEVAFVEAFGTGTPLGDAVELRALGRVLAEGRPPGRPAAIGSIKANLGHLEAAAGIASLIKAALALHHRALPPTPSFESPNRHVPWDTLRVPTRLEAWPPDQALRAGVSAFAFSGTNAHVVLEGPPSGSSATPAPRPTPWLVLPLSAHSPGALAALAARWREFLPGLTEASGDLEAACFTATLRRSHHRRRLAVLGRTGRELAAQLAALHASGRDVAAPDDASAELRALAGRYVEGDASGLAVLHPQGGRCVRLPTYTFERERHWLDEPSPWDASASPPATAARLDWIYEEVWRSRPRPAGSSHEGARSLLIHGPDDPVALALARRLEAQGRAWEAQEIGADLERLDLRAARLVFYLARGLDASVCVHAALRIVQRLESALVEGPVTLILVTAGAQSIRAEDEVDPASATLWGLGKVLPFEHPSLRCLRIDLDPAEDPARSAEALAAEAFGPLDEDQLALRGGLRLAPRLVRAAARAQPGLALRSEGTYVVAGGLGYLGHHAVAWLVERGARRIALVVRRADDPRALSLREAMGARGVQVQVLAADVADRDALAAALATLPATWLPLRGVLHAAAVHDDAVASALTPPRVDAVLAPRISGAVNLSVLTETAPLDFFVLFASTLGVLGAPQGAAAAAADAFSAAFARARRRRGRPALSVHFSPWSDEEPPALGLSRHDLLVRTLDPPEALAALEHLIVARAVQAAVLPFDVPDMLHFYPRALTPFFAELLTEVAPASSVAPSRRPELVHTYVAARTPTEQRLAQIWREALGVDRVGLHDGFFELGGDSVLAGQVAIRVNAAFGTALTLDAALTAFTVEKLAAVVEDALLRAVEEMSDEDAERLLAADLSPPRTCPHG